MARVFKVAWIVGSVLVIGVIVHWYYEQRVKYGGVWARLRAWVKTQDTTNRFYAWELPGAIWFGALIIFLALVVGLVVYVLVDTTFRAAAKHKRVK